MAPKETGTRRGFNENQTHDFAHVATRDEIFERLIIGKDVVSVELIIPARRGQDRLAEHAEFGVDKNMRGFAGSGHQTRAKFGRMEGRDRQMSSSVDSGSQDRG